MCGSQTRLHPSSVASVSKAGKFFSLQSKLWARVGRGSASNALGVLCFELWRLGGQINAGGHKQHDVMAGLRQTQHFLAVTLDMTLGNFARKSTPAALTPGCLPNQLCRFWKNMTQTPGKDQHFLQKLLLYSSDSTPNSMN